MPWTLRSLAAGCRSESSRGEPANVNINSARVRSFTRYYDGIVCGHIMHLIHACTHSKTEKHTQSRAHVNPISINRGRGRSPLCNSVEPARAQSNRPGRYAFGRRLTNCVSHSLFDRWIRIACFYWRFLVINQIGIKRGHYNYRYQNTMKFCLSKKGQHNTCLLENLSSVNPK